ncbi:MAG: DUF3616 domain-containing protein, partial [Planctomycetes bacterium]|nr:DUF3616 domain-containing protein [Planctomycetota bacterium]
MIPRTLVPSLAPLTALLAFAASVAAQITPGNLIVVRTGTGAAALNSSSTAVFLEELTTSGAAVQTLAMPTAVSGANLPVTNSGSATSEGFITQSADGRYLVTVGYAAAPGVASIVGTPAATTARVVARIALDGTIDTSTGLTDAYSGNNIRSACSFDGSSFWTAGTGSAPFNRGICYVAAVGAAASSQLSDTAGVTNFRVANIFNDQLYTSSQSGAAVGVNTVGVGVPNVGPQTVAVLPGFPGAGSPNQYDYWLADATTLYVADERSPATGGGIQKWTFAAGVWSLAYTLAAPGTNGCRGLSGIRDQNGTRLYATTTEGNANRLVTVLDTGAGSVFDPTLATAGANTAFRGVRFVRTPSSATLAGTG